jgi:nucleobase:cation symporter-1, NCS1 family
VYVIGLLARLPFPATHFYCPFVAPLDAADVDWIIGLAVPALA